MKDVAREGARRSEDQSPETATAVRKILPKSQPTISRLLLKVNYLIILLIHFLSYLLQMIYSLSASHRARDRSTEGHIRRTKKARDVSSKRQRNRRDSNERPSAQV